MNEVYLTPTRLEELKAELDHLRNERRREIAERLKRAKELGDLSENSEYQEAREEQQQVEGKIVELESQLRQAVLIAQSKGGNIVEIGSTIEVKKNGGNPVRFTIVGSNEADPREGRISNESPLGHAFLGRRSKDIVTVETPAGTMTYTILKIE